MRKLKKYISMGLAVCICVSMTACGGRTKTTTTEEPQTAVTYETMEKALLERIPAEHKEHQVVIDTQETTDAAGVMSDTTADATGTQADSSTDAVADTTQDTSESDTEQKDKSLIETITFWYTDDQDISYLQAASESFEKRYGIHVDYILRNDADILAAVNQANEAGEAPDAYMLSNDLIRKAQMAGLVEKNAMYDDQFWNEHYPAVSKNALSSGVSVYGYPIYLDTFFMLYDQDYAGEPLTIENVLEFSENFVDEENTKEIFRWDISDPFYNFMFLGGYASLLGATGEDTSQFDVTNQYVLDSMTYFQSIHDILSMDMEESSYEKIKKKIRKNKLIYAICKTDILPILEETQNAYKLAKLPKLTDTLDSGSLSITYAACVNPYADSVSAATLFSIYLSYEYSDQQFGLTRHVSARSDIARENENDQLIYEQYMASDTIPKALEMGDFWTYSEVAFSNIWDGNDVATELQTLQDTVRGRLN